MNKGRVLYLSGGGFRAALMAAGCVGFLATNGVDTPGDQEEEKPITHWDSVDQVVSVSGGSFLNAALASDAMKRSGAAEEPDDVLRSLGNYLTRMTSPRARPLGVPGGLLLALVFGVVLAALLAGSVWLALQDRAWLALAAGVCFAPVALKVTRSYLAITMRRLARTAIGSRPPKGLDTGDRQHIICAAGLSSAQPLFFTWSPKSGSDLRPHTVSGDSVFKALQASISVPFSASVPHPGESGIGEVLCDPGWAGKFGEQWRLGAFDESRSVLTASAWALDAGTHEATAGRSTAILGRLSMIVRLTRWLAVSNEAIYANDLWDLERRGLIRACEQVGNPSSAKERLTTAAYEIPNLGFDTRSAATAVVAGYVATWHKIGQLPDDETIAVELREFGARLDRLREVNEGSIINWSVELEHTWREFVYRSTEQPTHYGEVQL